MLFEFLRVLVVVGDVVVLRIIAPLGIIALLASNRQQNPQGFNENHVLSTARKNVAPIRLSISV